MLSQRDRDELDALTKTIRDLQARLRQQEHLFLVLLVLTAQQAPHPEKAAPDPTEQLFRLMLVLLAAAAGGIFTLLTVVAR